MNKSLQLVDLKRQEAKIGTGGESALAFCWQLTASGVAAQMLLRLGDMRGVD